MALFISHVCGVPSYTRASDRERKGKERKVLINDPANSYNLKETNGLRLVPPLGNLLK